MVKLLTKTIHQSYFVVGLALGIIFGIILALVFRFNYFASPLWLIFSGGLLLVAFFWPKLTFIVLAFLAGCIFAFFRVALELKGENYIHNFIGQTVIITGVVDGDPGSNESTINLKIRNLRFGEEKNPTAGTVYVSLNNNSASHQVNRSDIVTIAGKLDNGFGTYSGYLYKPNITNIKYPEPGDLILKIRNWFAARVKSHIPEVEVNLGLSYLLGMKTNLDKDLSENLRTVGLVHIVVASGTHLSILVEVARRIFGKFSRFSGLLFSILFILFFMSLVGFTPSIMRAGFMSILTLLAWYTGRKIAPWRIIVLVAAFTLLINPMFVIDLGWLLSFASYAGIMILTPHFTTFFYGNKKPGFIASLILATISATLMTLPITLYYFGTISLISILANLLVLPTLSYALGLVFLTGVLANVPLINVIFAFLTTKLLDFHIFIVEFFASQTSFLISIEPYKWQVFLIYLVIFLPLAIGLIRQKMVKSYQIITN